MEIIPWRSFWVIGDGWEVGRGGGGGGKGLWVGRQGEMAGGWGWKEVEGGMWRWGTQRNARQAMLQKRCNAGRT